MDFKEENMASFLLRQLLVMALMSLVNTICYKQQANKDWQVQCPDGKVMAPTVDASRYKPSNITQLLRELYRGFVGKQTLSFHETNSHPIRPEDFLNQFQCVPADHIHKSCQDQYNRQFQLYVSSETCGYIIGCLEKDSWPEGWNFTLSSKPPCEIYTYTYIIVGEMFWEIGTSLVSLRSGRLLTTGNTRSLLLTSVEKPIFVIGYEVLAQDESSSLALWNWKHGDCWKRRYPDTDMYQDTPLHNCTDAPTTPSAITDPLGGAVIPVTVIVLILFFIFILTLLIIKWRRIIHDRIKNKTSGSESHTTMNNTQESAAYTGPASSPSTQAVYVNVEDNDYAEVYDTPTRRATYVNVEDGDYADIYDIPQKC